MSQIIFLAPDKSMLTRARSLLKKDHPDIHIEEGLLSKGVEIATALVAKGSEIIITRGGTAAAISQAGLPVTIVEIPITGFDIIRTIEKAKLSGRCIGAVSFPSILQDMESLSTSLGVSIRLYPLQQENQAEDQVLKAFHEGADIVVGGFITGQAAQKHNRPFALIDSGSEGILQAAQEAKRIAAARNLEKGKTNLFRAVLTYAYEGILSVDQNECITFFNPIAERITGINGKRAIGEKIASLWPALHLGQVMRTKTDDLGHILKINGSDVLCNKIVILVNHQVVGAVVTFQDVAQIQQMEARVRRRLYSSSHAAELYFEDILGVSPIISQAISMAKDFALTNSSILIFGETGTGKEVFAQSIHNYSARHQGPFIAINCAALPNQILESELFGYVGGAFTGANPKGKPGLFEVAHEGTIFLDEISEMDYGMQGKLLRVLQEKKVRRVGSDSVIPIDVRVIAASNKNLWTLVNNQQFRADLYYRLNVLQLRLPPLRERKEDIPLLAQFFLAEHTSLIKHHLKLAPSAIQALSLYDWPGNIRELRNLIERIVAVHKQEAVDATVINHLLDNFSENKQEQSVLPNEAEEIRKALVLSKGKQAEAANILGISRSTLWRKLKRLGIK